MMIRTITTSFELWSTEQLLLVYQRYYGKLDAQARRRIVETARLNGWDRTWRDGVELLAAGEWTATGECASCGTSAARATSAT